MPRFRNLSAAEIETKADPSDYVTKADKAAEIVITAGLQAAFPEAFVFGEEAVSADPQLLQGLKDARLALIIDPIDGTGNFVGERPRFGTIVAVVALGEIIAGLIYNPNTENTHWVLRGEGAWVTNPEGEDSELTTKPRQKDKLLGSGGLKFLPADLKEPIRARLKKFSDYEHAGSCAVRYPELASGQLDFMFFNRLLPWDHAAGWLLHKEAGGYSQRLDGITYRPTNTEGPLLLARDKETWQRLHDKVFGDFYSSH